MTPYIEFLKSKIEIAPETGFDVKASEIHPILKPHQRDAVIWALKGGRRALFEAFGLGKTIQQLEYLRLVAKYEPGKVLIVCPLGVKQEFQHDAVELLDMPAPVYVRNMDEVRAVEHPFCITNYERVRDGDIDPTQFVATSLDEASVLRSFGSKTYQAFLNLFKGVQYKLVCTATPSPNKYKELIHYGGYLEVMDTGQALTRFFQRDSTQANNLTLYKHREAEFWLWLSTWALFIQRPSDLGYDDTGYDLPELDVRYHEIPVDHLSGPAEKDGQTKLFRDAAEGLKEAAREKRDSIDIRIEEIGKILYEYSCIDSFNQEGGHATQRPGSREGVSGQLLSEKQVGVAGKRETEITGDAGRSKAEKERILSGMVCEEQRSCLTKAERTECEKLSREQGKIQSQKQEMETGKPPEIQAANERVSGKEQGQTQIQIGGVVSEQQGTCICAIEETETCFLRHDAGGLCCDAESAERCLCNMRGSQSDCHEEAPTHRPLSPDRGSEGASLSPLQCGSGIVQGRCATSEVSNCVSQQYVIWCDLNDEQEAIEAMLKRMGISCSSVQGNQSIEEKERRLLAWKRRETSVLLSKTEMLGSGANLQQSSTMIFAGINYKFNDLFQGIHRIHRFGQTEPAKIHIIYTESEKAVLNTLMDKWKQHNELVENMTKIIKEYGLATTCAVDKMARQIGVERKVAKGEHYTFVNNDCVLESASMETNSIDLIHTSIPFSNHYEYTPSYNDFGHNQNNDRFFEQMDFLTPQLLRILKPGRVAAIHVKDRVMFGNATGTGMPTIDPFHVDCIQHYRKHGFQYFGMITVVTDVVRENNQTYRLGWTECCKDGSKMGVGCPEYVLLFRKLPTDTSRAYADVPVSKSKEEYTRAQWQLDAHAYWRSSGNRLLTIDELANTSISDLQRIYREQSRNAVYSYQEHVELAKRLDDDGRLPSTFMVVAPGSHTDEVWDDVNRMRTLNGEQVRRNVQMHVCPLQFDIVERVINRFSNKGDLVFDPFGGISTVPYMAVKMGRNGYGSELNPDYWKDGCGYLKNAELEADMPTLFDLMDAA